MRGSWIVMWALAGCFRPEVGIDDTIVYGEVQVLPVLVEEGNDDRNDNHSNAVALGEVSRSIVVASGKLRSFDLNDSGMPTDDADRDWYSYEVAEDVDLEIRLSLPDGVSARVSFFNLDEVPGVVNRPDPIASEDVSGNAVLYWPSTRGVNWGLRIMGLEGTDKPEYDMALIASDPNDLSVLVGAWANPDIVDRGAMYGGAEVGDFELGIGDDPWQWTAGYELRRMREFEDGLVDEELDSAWLFAGSWYSLNQGLPAGTWYSGIPVEVSVDDMETTASPLVLDEYISAVVGFTYEEQEPNELSVDADGEWITPVDPAEANDLGVLSGPGFVDIITGSTSFYSADYGYIHDDDAFVFELPSTLQVNFVLGWEGDADIDIYLIDEEAEIWEYGASYDNPELGGGYYDLKPSKKYFLSVLGYLGPDGEDVPYELKIETSEP